VAVAATLSSSLGSKELGQAFCWAKRGWILLQRPMAVKGLSVGSERQRRARMELQGAAGSHPTSRTSNRKALLMFEKSVCVRWGENGKSPILLSRASPYFLKKIKISSSPFLLADSAFPKTIFTKFSQNF
jgi:hypothetical protein